MTELACTSCRARLLLPLGHTGPTYRCPFCSTTLPVPDAPSEEPPRRVVAAASWLDDDDTPSREPPPPAPLETGDAAAPAATAPAAAPLAAVAPAVAAPAAPPLARGGPTRVIVYAGLAIVALGVLFGVLVMVAGSVKRAADRAVAMNNMKQIGLACQNYQDVYKFLPTPKMVSKEGEPVDLSWRVSILGYIEEERLRQRFDQSRGWDSPENKQFLGMMPALYVDPQRQQEPDKGEVRPTQFQTTVRPTQFQTTHFQLFTGPGTAFPHNDKLGPRDFPDNGFLFAEAAQDVPWTKPADMIVQPSEPLPLPAGTVLVGLADGSVRAIDRDRVSDETLRWYLRPGSGTPPPLD